MLTDSLTNIQRIKIRTVRGVIFRRPGVGAVRFTFIKRPNQIAFVFLCPAAQIIRKVTVKRTWCYQNKLKAKVNKTTTEKSAFTSSFLFIP